jgi:hypothetical protein
MINTGIKVNNGKQELFFDIVHNLDEMGLNIMDAFENWAARTKKCNVKSFCDYVKSKDPQIICMTKKDYDKL